MSKEEKQAAGQQEDAKDSSLFSADEIEFPSVDDLLADLQPVSVDLPQAPSAPAPAQAAPEPPAQPAPAQMADPQGEQTQQTQQDTPPEPDEDPENGDEAQSESEEDGEPEEDELWQDEDALEELEPQDELAGLPFWERTRQRARIRRREQTRQRRENARRREDDFIEVPYQAMTKSDIQILVIRLAAAVASLLIGVALSKTKAAFAFYLIAYLITAFPVAVTVARNLTHRKYFNEYLLILLASLGAFLLGRRPEATIVLIMHSVGKVISDLVIHSTRKSLTKETDFAPEQASVVNMKGEEKRVNSSEINMGDFIMVRSGERIPIDGEVLRGEGTVDTAVLTGESDVVAVVKGVQVLAGSLYNGTLLLIRATARFEDCAISQIIHIQQQANVCRSSLEDGVMQSATRYMPFIVAIAVVIALVPPLFNFSTPSVWIYRALTALVICCPTTLLLSIPLTFLGGRGRLYQRGIQVKGSEAIEKLAELRMAVFDKTGILTDGQLRVKEVHPTADFNAASCLALAATAEQGSKHLVARAIVAASQGIPKAVSEFEEFPGRGVRARVGKRTLLVGNRKLMVSRGVKKVPEISGTVVYVAYEGEYAGAIVLEDTVRPEAASAIAGLKTQGVLRTVILTGDTERPTQQVADEIGIDTVHSGLMPDEKASKMEFLLRTIPTDGTAAYIGDGVNDLAELRLADVGVAMGAAGSLEAADAASVLIMSDNLTRFTEAVRISRVTHGIAMQNMVLLFGVKAILVVLALLGAATMWQAVAADVLMTVMTVLNAARTLNAK